MGWLLAPGFFSSAPVIDALIVGGVVAAVSAVVGVFVVMRAQSFAGHALGDLGAAGASGAFLVGVSALWGFLTAGLVSGGVMEVVGNRRPRQRDLATGIVLAGALGVAALFLYLDTTVSSTSGAPVTILFGSIFLIDPSLIPVICALAAVALGLVALVARTLLLSSLSPDLAAARGVRVRLVGLAFMAAMAIAVEQSALTIGALLSTALLIGPPAAALHRTSRPGRAVALAVVLGVVATWLGIVLAYDSYDWPPNGRGWPVSFFVVSLVLAVYGLSRLPWPAGGGRRDAVAGPAPGG